MTGLSPAAAHLPLTPANAAEYFAEATRDCRADDGKLWSVSLCGPMLFVDPATRQVIASQADADGRLKPANDGTFAGVMSPDQIIANTCAWWSGTQWIEVLWPIPASATMGRTIMAHEAYHCVQKQIVPIDLPGTNAQLETVYGRYTMQLEWRALAAALKASTDAARRQAASDALLFRVARYHSFPKAQAREVALERDEGLAEYTGVMVGNATATQRKAVALELLREGPELPSFVSSFAYITGPAYGLLLDRYRPDWRKQIIHNKQGLAAMLAPALHLKLAHMPLTTFAARAAHYGGDALLASENTREAERNREIAHYRALLVTGPVLVLPLKDTRKQYNSLTLLSLGRSGTVYPTLRLFDVWGSIDVKKGALMAPNQSHLTVAAPSGGTVTGTIHGPGWTLKLLPGWRLARGVRKGDFTLQLGPMQRGGQRSSGQ
ncbi:MAG: hypothetical protein ACREPY_08985 [Rhodanobacteraceae bacterium]